MILTVGGFVIQEWMIYLILTFGIVGLIQPYFRIWKDIGALIAIGAYALLPFIITGAP